MNPRSPSGHSFRLSRRQVLIGTAGSAVTAVLANVDDVQVAADTRPEAALPPTSHVALTINGRRYALDVDNRITLLDVLRERLQLTGTKKGCDHGQCGACTVIVEGRRINASCMKVTASPQLKGSVRQTTCTLYSPRLSSMTATSVVTARQARSAQPSRCLRKYRQAYPATSPSI